MELSTRKREIEQVSSAPDLSDVSFEVAISLEELQEVVQGRVPHRLLVSLLGEVIDMSATPAEGLERSYWRRKRPGVEALPVALETAHTGGLPF